MSCHDSSGAFVGLDVCDTSQLASWCTVKFIITASVRGWKKRWGEWVRRAREKREPYSCTDIINYSLTLGYIAPPAGPATPYIGAGKPAPFAVPDAGGPARLDWLDGTVGRAGKESEAVGKKIAMGLGRKQSQLSSRPTESKESKGNGHISNPGCIARQVQVYITILGSWTTVHAYAWKWEGSQSTAMQCNTACTYNATWVGLIGFDYWIRFDLIKNILEIED